MGKKIVNVKSDLGLNLDQECDFGTFYSDLWKT